jgi:hypothetical protein
MKSDRNEVVMQPNIQSFFDSITGTVTYVVYPSGGHDCAIIDPVLEYDPKTGGSVAVRLAG